MRPYELRPWGHLSRRPSAARELIAFAHGAIVHVAFDGDPLEVLDRLHEVLVELRRFVASISTRARGGIETKSPGSRR